jgi:lipid A 4'-phosphatase
VDLRGAKDCSNPGLLLDVADIASPSTASSPHLPGVHRPFQVWAPLNPRGAGPAWIRYLKPRRVRLVLLCFLSSSLLLVWFPALDLQISRWFFGDGGFFLADQWWSVLLHESVGYVIGLSLATVMGLYVFNSLSRRNLGGIDGRKVLYLLVVLILGAGLVVNVALKQTFGRARPRNVVEFGGTQRFTPAFVVSGECATNCSFSSGDGAGAFFCLAIAWGLSRKRAILVAALGFGGIVSLSRIAVGAHFFSDSVVSFFVMVIVTDAMYFFMLGPGRELGRRALAVNALHGDR